MILFISDLHLDPSRPAITQAFFKFLKQDARQAEALYILGDLFELWIGDDDDDASVLEIQQQLKQLSDSGTALYFMHGNRDFLIAEQFAKNTGATLLEDPTLITITINNKKENVLLMHGDTLCTKDKDYLAFRAQVRQEAWAKDILAKPLAERRALGKHLRSQSKSMSSRKADDIMDVSEDEVIRVMEKYSATKLIHGHTHRPFRHSLENKISADSEQKPERIVLGDWDKQGWCLRVDKEWELESWEII
ncbi:UDP-2,3-diacylglucosamine diphosphatase [Aurantivibrio infirmus]